jgi:polysaccharide export outer membrane protein
MRFSGFSSRFISATSSVQRGTWCAVIVVPCLMACASGPNFGSLHNSSGSSRTSSSQASGGGGAADEDLSNATLTPITSHLVKSEREKRDKLEMQDISALVVKGNTNNSYKIDNGDVLSIVVWDYPELSNTATVQNYGYAGTGADASVSATTAPPAGFIVDNQGMIQFPFAGALKVSGLTQDEARNLLTQKLSRYLKKPKVTLRVQSFRSKRVYIDGEVKTPGLQSINDITMTLNEALNRAGGVLPTGDQSQILITRAGKTYQINLPQLVQRGVNPNNIVLKDGDVVRVRSRDESKVFVSGEVVAPRALPMYNGRLSLNEALGEAGGVNPVTGDTSQIYVVRKSGSDQTIYQLDASKPGALAMAEGFELQPKDVVYVAASALANWHRTISSILPGELSAAYGAANQPGR